MNDLAAQYARLRLAVVGDFCLDRYLEIDPSLQERSLETGRAVHNVVRVRSQPGGAGTIVNNLVALGITEIHVVGFTGDDGEGFELRRALGALAGVRLEHFQTTPLRHTFTYAKPLILREGQPPEELDRLDTKNWTPTPNEVQERIIRSLDSLSTKLDGVVLLDQVDVAETGVVTRRVREMVGGVARRRPNLWILADSRRGLNDFPPLVFKMNRSELAALLGTSGTLAPEEVRQAARELARRNGRMVFVTLSEEGLLGAAPDGETVHVPALPIRGPIDIVGAGDAVAANLTAALSAGASLREALELANAAASVVVHQLGTTGTATLVQIEQARKLQAPSA